MSLKQTRCLVCESEKLSPMTGSFAKHELLRCRNCGFVFMERIPTLEELQAHYSLYSRQLYYPEATRQSYLRLLDRLEPHRKTGRWLDIGCDVGNLLDEAKKRGWEVYGTEYTENAVLICRQKGITMSLGGVEDCGFEPNSFDVITSIEVLEHLNAPHPHLKAIHALLRPGGVHYCTTPNFNSLERRWVKGNHPIIEYPEHLSLYSTSTIKRLFRSEGFRVKRVWTTGISLSRFRPYHLPTEEEKQAKAQALSSPDYNPASTSDERLRARLARNPLLRFVKWSVNGFLNLTRFGNSLKGEFVKPG